MIRSRKWTAERSGQSGFTLVEMVVALGVTAIVMLGILMLFDFNNKLTRVQSNVADMQQSLRIAQYDMARLARMAGRGGLTLTQGVVLDRDVEEDTYLAPDEVEDQPIKLMAGTDVLTLRGVFSTPIFHVSFTDARSLVLNNANPALATSGYVEICALSPSGKAQDLNSVKDQLRRAEALIMVSPLDDQLYIVVELDTANTTPGPVNGLPSCPGPSASGLKVAFTIDSPYSGLSAPPAQAQLALEKVAFVGFLEEYRFYVRDDRSGRVENEVAEMTPVLSRARFFPGTDKPYAGDEENARQDIADGIMDLQFALGFDTDNDGRITEDLDEPETDEWFGNDADDGAPTGDFKGLRISTLVRTRRLDNTYRAEVLTGLEDHAYTEEADDRVNGEIARKYRRRVLQTIVNLRNLTT